MRHLRSFNVSANFRGLATRRYNAPATTRRTGVNYELFWCRFRTIRVGYVYPNSSRGVDLYTIECLHGHFVGQRTRRFVNSNRPRLLYVFLTIVRYGSHRTRRLYGLRGNYDRVSATTSCRLQRHTGTLHGSIYTYGEIGADYYTTLRFYRILRRCNTISPLPREPTLRRGRLTPHNVTLWLNRRHPTTHEANFLRRYVGQRFARTSFSYFVFVAILLLQPSHGIPNPTNSTATRVLPTTSTERNHDLQESHTTIK